MPDIVTDGERATSCVMSGGYEACNGTSMATLIVSGVVALVLERHDTISMLDPFKGLIDTRDGLNVAFEY